MAKYRIQRAKGVEGSTIYTYTAPGHNECVPTRLFDVDGGGANDIEGGKMIMGITYFVPGGGCDYGANPLESIYYILTGAMHSIALAALRSPSPTPAPRLLRCWFACCLPRSKTAVPLH